MQAVFVKFQDRHRIFLKEKARQRGCTMSDLVREATIDFFSLPTDGPDIAVMEQKHAESPGVTPAAEASS